MDTRKLSIDNYKNTGNTAAQIIAERANADKPNMGLQTWKNPQNVFRSHEN
jgi:hypothetical protein